MVGDHVGGDRLEPGHELREFVHSQPLRHAGEPTQVGEADGKPDAALADHVVAVGALEVHPGGFEVMP